VKFHLDQHFDGDVDDVVALYCDPAFYEALTGLTKVATPEAIRCERTDGQVVLELAYRFIAPLPGAVTAVVEPAKLTWREITTFDLVSRSSATRFVPDHYADRLHSDIACRYIETDSGTTRLIDGELKVRMLLVGGQVERAIVSGISEHLAEESVQAAARLAH